MTVYLEDSVGLVGNWERLVRLGDAVKHHGRPAIVGGDWNFGPDELRGAQWTRGLGSFAMSAGRTTCMQGTGSEIDYFTAESRLSAAVRKVEVMFGASTNHHRPVAISFEARVRSITALQQQKLDMLPSACPKGPAPPPPNGATCEASSRTEAQPTWTRRGGGG